jgi:non-specific serine/threonine protein kinase
VGFRELGQEVGIAACLEGITQVAIAIAQPMPAVRLFGAAAAIRDRISHPPYPEEQIEYDSQLGEARAQLDAATFAAAWAAGQAMTTEQAIAEALRVGVEAPPAQTETSDQAPQPASAAPHSLSTLTRRERQVLALLAQGASNRAIAEALVIAERTAEIHVSNILGKLGLASRTQAAAYALAHGLAAAPEK